MANTDDLIIIQKVLTGDRHAYATIVNNYKDMAVNLAYNILMNREDAEEVVQDAFVKVYKSLRSFKSTAKFSTWLYRIIVNTALNKKKIKKHITTPLSGYSTNDQPVDFTDTMASYIGAEHKKHIQFAMRSLNDNERICLTLYYLDELCVEEITELTGISVSNVKVLLYRGRKSLYKSLYKYLKYETDTLI